MLRENNPTISLKIQIKFHKKLLKNSNNLEEDNLKKVMKLLKRIVQNAPLKNY